MAVNYREVNQYQRVSANQLPYKDMLFQQLGSQQYYAEVDKSMGLSSLTVGQGEQQGYSNHYMKSLYTRP